MASYRTRALLTVICAFIGLPLIADTRAQEDEVNAALVILEETEAYKRSELRNEIVRRYRSGAMPVVLERLQNINGNEDENLVGQLIQLTGDIIQRSVRDNVPAEQHARATDLLLQHVRGANMSLAYQAIDNLTDIWAMKDIPRDDTRLPDVNGALLATVHGRTPDYIKRAAVVGLTTINGIEIRPRLRENRYPLVPLEEFTEKIDAYFEANPARLPVLAKRPWQLHLHTLVTTSDSDTRTAAFETLKDTRPIDAVDRILDILRDSEGLNEGVRQNLAALLDSIAGIPYPPATQADESPVDAWWQLWLTKLRDKEDVALLKGAVDYVWRSLEEELYFYNVNPTEEGSERIKALRRLLMYLVDSDEQIPVTATAGARQIMEPPLRSKARLALALEYFTRPRANRDVLLREAGVELSREWGEHIGRQYLQKMVNLAAVETDKQIAFQIGGLLRTVTKVPVNLNLDSPLLRQRALREWATAVRDRGFDVTVPEA